MQTFLMLIRRLGILCYLLLPSSKVIAVFKEMLFAHVTISAEKLTKCILSVQLPADQKKKEQAFILIYFNNLEQNSM